MATTTQTQPILLLLCLFTFSFLAATTTTSAAATPSGGVNFIRSKCSSTKYPATCITSLQSYASKIQQSPRQLAQTALIVSLSKARSAKSYVGQLGRAGGLKPREAGAVKDCMEEIGDTVDRLGKSVREFNMAVRAGKRDFLWHMNNVQTWASAALTDENTCVDGFEGRALEGRVKAGIKAQLDGVMQCTSNALALVNQFANRYR